MTIGHPTLRHFHFVSTKELEEPSRSIGALDITSGQIFDQQ
jgi:hypothetical protein